MYKQAAPGAKQEQSPNVIDGGCSTLEGLTQRCSLFHALYGAGKLYRHPDGFMYVANDGYRVLVVLPPAPE